MLLIDKRWMSAWARFPACVKRVVQCSRLNESLREVSATQPVWSEGFVGGAGRGRDLGLGKLAKGEGWRERNAQATESRRARVEGGEGREQEAGGTGG